MFYNISTINHESFGINNFANNSISIEFIKTIFGHILFSTKIRRTVSWRKRLHRIGYLVRSKTFNGRKIIRRQKRKGRLHIGV